jgi:hypothetical protein
MAETLRLRITRTDTGEQIELMFELRSVPNESRWLILVGPEAVENASKLTAFLKSANEDAVHRILPTFYYVQFGDGVPFRAMLSAFKVNLISSEPAIHVHLMFRDWYPPRLQIDLPPAPEQ